MEGEGFLESFFQADHADSLISPKLLLDCMESYLGLSAALLRIRPGASCHGMPAQISSEIVCHILTLMPLTPLDDP